MAGQERRRKGRQQDQGRYATVLVDSHRPGATDSGQGRDPCEGRGHAGQQWQPAPKKGLLSPRKHEGQYRQNARAQDRQYAAEECQQCQSHGWLSPLTGYSHFPCNNIYVDAPPFYAKRFLLMLGHRNRLQLYIQPFRAKRVAGPDGIRWLRPDYGIGLVRSPCFFRFGQRRS